MKELQRILDRLGRETGILATLVSVEGSSYRRAGARMLVVSDDEHLGSISGGCLETDVCARAKAVRSTGRAEVITYDTTSENDLVWGVGLGCHGVVRVLLERLPARPGWAERLASNQRGRAPTDLAVVWEAPEPSLLGTYAASELPNLPAGSRVFRQMVPPPIPLVIFGAGDDAQPLARGAAELGWHVTIADPRPAFATRERFPTADAIVVGPAESLSRQVGPGPDSLVAIMTHHYVHDVPILRDLLPRPLAFLGLLGPRKRAERILADLAKNGGAPTSEQLARLHAPIGLDLGAETPAEVAVSILAEMRAALSGRDARPLRERIGKIHDEG